jgi:hypothetical protein
VSGRTATVQHAARQAAGDGRRLLALSRPAAWLLTGSLFVVGAFEAERGWTTAILLGVIYFLGPFNLLRYGLDAIASADQGEHDPAAVRFAIATTNLPLLAAMVLFGGAAVGFVLIVTLALVVAETTNPIRLRCRPVLDLAVAASLTAAPLVCGLVLGGRDVAGLPWIPIMAVVAWGAGTAAISTIMAPAPRSTAALLGARGTAAIALLAYATSAVLAASLGSLGVFAAVGLALFLLLPATVLVAPGTQPRASIAAGRAEADRSGLTVLVGAWLVVLLLQHWGITRYDPWLVAIAVPSMLAAYALANIIAIRIATRRHRVRDDAQTTGADGPSVTIIVPCHDAVADLRTCLAALRAQTYPDASVLVVDDGSTDGSADEAAAWLGEDAVLRAPPRPDGWTGRAWARHVGANTAASDMVLFVDPGVVLAPIAVRILVEQTLTRRDDLLLGLPRDLLATPAERAAAPGFLLVRFGFAPLWWPAITGNRPAALAFGDGALVLVRRSAFLAAEKLGRAAATAPTNDTGKESAIDPPEDSLPRVLSRAGSRVAAVRMADLAAERRYRSVADVVTAWRLRILPYGRGRLAGALVIVGLVLTTYLVPLLLPAIAILGREDPDIIAASLVPLAVLLVMRLALAITQRQSPATIAWHPVTVIVTLIGQVAGIADHVLGRRES